MKTTEYFRYTRRRPDRAKILDAWIEMALRRPDAELVQSDGRVRRWVFVKEEQRYLRVVLLADRETVHNAFFDRKIQAMNVKYFKDTDTALLEFSSQPVDETKEISANVFVDLDKDGNLVSMTIEHAAQFAALPRVSLEEIGAPAV